MKPILPGIDHLEHVIIRTNAGPDIGLGHYRRCASFARRLIDAYGCLVQWFGNVSDDLVAELGPLTLLPENSFDDAELQGFAALHPDLIVIDSYLPSFDWLQSLRRIAPTLLFDDNVRFAAMPADLVLNGNLYANELPYRGVDAHTRFLLGEHYLFLGPEYLHIEPVRPCPGSALLTTGGGDDQHVVPRLIPWLDGIPDWQYRLVIGPFFTNEDQITALVAGNPRFSLCLRPESLKEEILRAEVVISASGTTALEAMTCRRPLILFQTADNQLRNGRAMAARGLAIDLGPAEDLTPTALAEALAKVRHRKVRKSD